ALYRRVIVDGTSNALDVAQISGARSFVNISTGGALYGETPACATEESRVEAPSPYGRYKAEAERLAQSTPGLTAATLRFANIYGPRQRTEREGEIQRSCLDSSKAARDGLWRTSVALADGLRLTVAAT